MFTYPSVRPIIGWWAGTQLSGLGMLWVGGLRGVCTIAKLQSLELSILPGHCTASASLLSEPCCLLKYSSEALDPATEALHTKHHKPLVNQIRTLLKSSQLLSMPAAGYPLPKGRSCDVAGMSVKSVVTHSQHTLVRSAQTCYT